MSGQRAGRFAAAALALALAGGGLAAASSAATVRVAGSAGGPVGSAGEPVPARFDPVSVSFISASQGFVLGASSCARTRCTSLVATFDGGRSWVRLRAPGAALAPAPGAGASAPGAVSEVDFANASDGFAYGPGLWSTTNGAATWSQVRLGGPVLALAASGGFADAVVASCSPSNPGCSSPLLRLERAPVGSGPWRVVAGITGYDETLLSLRGPEGWVAMWPRKPYSAPASVWTTSDAGATWRRVPDHCFKPAQATDLAGLASPGGSLLFELCAGNPGAGQEGKEVLASADAGATAHVAGQLPPGGLAAGLAAASRRVLVVSASSGAGFLYRSGDGGRTWVMTRLVDGGSGLSGLAFITPAVGVVIDGHPGDAPFPDRLLMTRDGGTTWSAVPILPSGGPSAGARIGPSAVWSLWRTGQPGAAEACIYSHSPALSPAQLKNCVERFMRAHGASPAAVAYFDTTGSYLVGFADAGLVDLGYTLSAVPMDCGCFSYVLLNGAHQDLVPPVPSLASPAYAKLRQAYRLSSGYSGLSYLFRPPFLEAARMLAGRGEELVLQFQLNDICNACATPYRARVGYRLSETGALVGSVSLGPCLGPMPPSSAARTVKVEEPTCPPVLAGPPE